MKKMISLICLAVFWSCQTDEIDPLEYILKNSPQEITQILDEKEEYEVQIIYTQIERDAQNSPHLKTYTFNVDEQKYFYPASTVKMPVAFLTIERINQLNKFNPELTLDSSILNDSIAPPQTRAWTDTSTVTGKPTFSRYIERIFSISDNNAYNRLYEFLGQDYINDELRKKRIFTNSRIRTRVGISGFNTESNKYTNPVRIVNNNGELLYSQVEQYAIHEDFVPLEDTKKGVGFFNELLDTTIYEPFDMSEKNFINLKDLEQSLIRIIFPELYPFEERFDISKDQYNFLYHTMMKYPGEFSFLSNSVDEYYDSYAKLFIHGDSKNPIPGNIKILNKVGWAYGYMTDCSYIIDTKNHIEFFLTATILVNKNKIFNDGKYEYEEIGLPFMAELGRQVYHYELGRRRNYRSDLSKFIFEQ